MKKTIACILVAAGLMVSSNAMAKGCSDGKNRRVVMVNDTTTDILRLYGSNVGADDWQEDVLGEEILAAGNRVRVNWDDGTCYCTFDFKAVYRDGTTSIKKGVNVCTIESFRFYD